MDLIFVPKGTTSIANGNITINENFYIGKYEVTQAEWQEAMTGNANGISATPSYFSGKPNNPVERVNWYETIVFCNRKSIVEGLTPVYSISGSINPDSWGTVPTSNNSTWNAVIVNSSANGYRLPTNNEWEYTARGGAGGSAFTYAGSNNIEEVAWYKSNTGNISHGVGAKLPNELGIYDMSGNVREWCYDWRPGYEGSSRVLRGGCWSDNSNTCTVSYVNNYNPGYRNHINGFRVCRSSTADITSPSFNSVNIDTIAYNSANLNVNSNEDGKVYYKILPRNATAPTSAELKVNPDGQTNVTANTTSIISLTGLASNANLDCYIVAEDTVPNLQLEPTKIQFTTLPLPPTPPTKYIQPPKITVKENIIKIESHYKIYYTTDGSYPNNTSLQYAIPIFIPPNTTTITAIAYSEKNLSFSHITQYTIYPKPTTTIYPPQ